MKNNAKMKTTVLLLTTAAAAVSMFVQLSSAGSDERTYQSSFRPTHLESNANTPVGMTLSESGTVGAVAELNHPN